MADLKQTVTRQDAQGIDEAGNNIQQTTKRIHTESSANKKAVATNVVWFIFGIISVLLAMRFVLKLTGANPINGFASFIYSASKLFSAPFDSIFGTSTTSIGPAKAVFQPSILVAVAVYAIVAWGIVKLINISSRPN